MSCSLEMQPLLSSDTVFLCSLFQVCRDCHACRSIAGGRIRKLPEAMPNVSERVHQESNTSSNWGASSKRTAVGESSALEEPTFPWSGMSRSMGTCSTTCRYQDKQSEVSSGCKAATATRHEEMSWEAHPDHDPVWNLGTSCGGLQLAWRLGALFFLGST